PLRCTRPTFCSGLSAPRLRVVAQLWVGNRTHIPKLLLLRSAGASWIIAFSRRSTTRADTDQLLIAPSSVRTELSQSAGDLSPCVEGSGADRRNLRSPSHVRGRPQPTVRTTVMSEAYAADVTNVIRLAKARALFH